MSFCKNCRFWKVQASGNMLHPPGRKPHMCTLRVHSVTTDEGDTHVFASGNPDHAPGPTYGMRTAPKDSCSYIITKGMPYRKPKE